MERESEEEQKRIVDIAEMAITTLVGQAMLAGPEDGAKVMRIVAESVMAAALQKMTPADAQEYLDALPSRLMSAGDDLGIFAGPVRARHPNPRSLRR